MKMTVLCLLNTFLMATGQMLFKFGSSGKEITSILDIIKLFFSPVVFIALCLYAATTGLWLYILSRTPMSHAYPIQALAFPIVLLASMVFFRETISPMKWIGVFIIVFGVFVATRG
ncbi:EamA family transporter [Agathobaculum sp. Marseille-P7918]|uniref:EamA family transporter n=1 Tax=Agathobaculum sp. Marseille-P7918 TaxID=2479843 RepID=UPI000F62FEA8|nr:EamA family transporter [Agathobaculum sp. Marseille-P7918]